MVCENISGYLTPFSMQINWTIENPVAAVDEWLRIGFFNAQPPLPQIGMTGLAKTLVRPAQIRRHLATRQLFFVEADLPVLWLRRNGKSCVLGTPAYNHRTQRRVAKQRQQGGDFLSLCKHIAPNHSRYLHCQIDTLRIVEISFSTRTSISPSRFGRLSM